MERQLFVSQEKSLNCHYTKTSSSTSVADLKLVNEVSIHYKNTVEMPLILQDIKLLEFDRIVDARGNLSFFENFNQIPFLIKRVEYFYDIPGGERFNGYAHKTTQQVIVALSGSFDVIVHNGVERKCITLNRSYHGLYLPGLIWRQLKNFSTNAVPLVVSNAHFNADDHITSFKSFISLKNE